MTIYQLPSTDILHSYTKFILKELQEEIVSITFYGYLTFLRQSLI